MISSQRPNSFEGLVPWERRRKVPWTGWDVALLFVLYLVLMQCGFKSMQQFRGPAPPSSTENVSATPTTEHAASQLLRLGRSSLIVLLVVFFGAVITAPLAEEFYFRLVLQGYLEKIETIFLRRSIFPHGMFSILFSALFFAGLHGIGRQEQDIDTLFFSLMGVAFSHLVFVVLGIVFLHWIRGATWADLGLKPRRLPEDCGRAVVFFVLFVPAIFALHIAVRIVYPDTVTDPIPLFFFSLILGFLFYRTRRLVGCILFHAMFNGVSFAIALFAAG